ncbi:reverse transcriptase-like protein [Mameliella alba]|uniref:RNase H n=1 Tax=Mameliella alba TaxID=561184 RepID=A0A0B3RWL3_9RHOB|nr:reverse transcriptase-like protein [Mameliella alba]KHQ51138.1 RNase H [Mameliella alba]
MTRATVITDASFCDRTKAAGWAAWVRIDGMAEPIKRYGSFSDAVSTSSEAEKKAALNGIWIAAQYGATEILLQSDCLAVVHLIDGTTKKRAPLDQWHRWCASIGILGLDLKSRHVRGHTSKKDARSHVNRWCDKHANKARMGKA